MGFRVVAMSADPRVTIVREWLEDCLASNGQLDDATEAARLVAKLDSHALAEHSGEELERVALALAEESNRQVQRAVSERDEDWMEDHRALARAALSAIRPASIHRATDEPAALPRRDERARALEMARYLRDAFALDDLSDPGSHERAQEKARELVALLTHEEDRMKKE
jgi:hypothetical protein